MIRFFLQRPIFAAVCSALILLAGAVVIPILPIARFPQIAPPVITVKATWTGASAQALESSVTTPLEEAINGVEGLRYISSTSTSAGVTTITCTFNLGTSLDIAAADVQNAVGTTTPLLPTAVQQTGVLVTKNSGALVLAYGFSSSNPQFDSLYLSNYVDLNIVDTIKRIPGISNVIVFGERKYAMRLWIDPKRLSDYGLTADDVVNALNSQNVSVAAGAIGGAPVASSQPFQINIRAVGRLTTPRQFDDLILSTLPDGGFVRFSDIGHVDLGAQDYSEDVRFDGHPAVAIGIQAYPTANALDVAKGVRSAMAAFQKDFPPGVTAKIAFDSSEFVTASLREVIITLGISIVLVVLVIFVFLQNARTTIVPVITIPISLIGTFAIIRVLGFSINTLTMFGLTLATGLVVDDAIVVIENIARFIQHEGMTPLRGAAAAMDEISGAVVASSLVLLAVFVPVAFFPGTTGQLYRQFALTIAGSITISLIVALTLTPVLSRLLLFNEERHNRFFDPVNRVIDATRRLYGRLLPMLMRGRMFVASAYVVGVAATVFISHITPTGFLPNEDQGYFFAQGQSADEASLPYTAARAAQVGRLIASYPEVADVLEASGQDFLSTGANRALFFVNLKPWAQRTGALHSLDGIFARLDPQLAMIPGLQAIAFNPPAIQGFANVAGFQFELEDRSNAGLGALNTTAKQLLAAANANPGLGAVYDTFRNDAPQLVVDVDREKVESLGIPLQSVFDAMEVSLGSLFVNQFDYLNRSYHVYVQADAPYRSRLDAFDSIYVHAPGGASVPLSALVHVSTETAAPIISHYNLFRSVEINGSPAPGRGSGEALAAMQQTAEPILPHGMSFEWSGLSLEQLASGAQGGLVFALGIVVVFLVLAAKYESLTDPLTILLSVPLAILGALLALGARHFVSDVYAQVGFVMLIGLASKNAILIVEFANQLRARGRDTVTAAIEAAETRFRPIIMTSLAFISAVLPLLVASGAGSLSRQSLGTTLFGGMIFASAVNLTLVPVLYVVVVQLRERFGSSRRETNEHLEVKASIRRGSDGDVILTFLNGGKPLQLRVAATPVQEDEE